MKTNEEILQALRGGLIVSCQALPEEPLYSSYIMSRMAYAAMLGGAVGIRANTPEDVHEIKATVNLPVLALYKKDYADSSVYITPTGAEVDALAAEHPEVIAMDATNRPRPNGLTLDEFFARVREKYPHQLFMADCATFEEGVHAQALGFDIISTTLCGYTEDTKHTLLPNLPLVGRLADALRIPVIAEGGIWEAEDLKQAFAQHAFAAVIGTAITRPREITRRYVQAISKEDGCQTRKNA
ncbi:MULTISPECIES: N-acetylmannosamine-6-phosphate 2-epimerase [Caproicibacterium]|uniref:Putative N-acetylmannosamine-6-phosphate 2-epimerase n=1 Tax=Caproicibacterium argilliputei TaxID=3030016 RepID=A0AA97DBZ8_9FIRM|nr:N-acetylmannosamine-6-phosphate 2-epimerase [Caproicibacterium argilliputei]WOC32785.1 N-acetylmannosamine-6-phosphate 2-epimerase [Caproicibacterium argilliputei]